MGLSNLVVHPAASATFIPLWTLHLWLIISILEMHGININPEAKDEDQTGEIPAGTPTPVSE